MARQVLSSTSARRFGQLPGRPSLLTEARACRRRACVFLKREDLNHIGFPNKINNVLGVRLWSRDVIADG